MNQQPRLSGSTRLLIILFLALAAGVGAVGYHYYSEERESHTRHVIRELRAIAETKARQVAAWRSERLADAYHIQSNPVMLAALEALARSEAAGAVRRGVEPWLESFHKDLGYASAIAVRADGRVIASAGRVEGNPQHYARLARQVLGRGTPVLTDFQEDPSLRAIHLALNTPLPVPGSGRPFGVLLLAIDPQDYLYPLIQSWPTPSETAETLLVRRDGDEVVYLNELRHRKGTALKLKASVNNTALPAGQALLGKTDIGAGIDYRGAPVLAAAAPITDSPWVLVAKVDAEEVYSPLRQTAVLIAALTAGLMLAAGAGAGLLWRRQQADFYRQRYESELQRKAITEHYGYLARYANDAMLLLDGQHRVVEANDRAVELYEYPREEMIGMHAREFRIPEEQPGFDRQWAAARENPGAIFETIHRAKSGRSFPVEVSVRFVTVEGRQFWQAIARDISSRKQMEERLRRTNQTLQALIEASPAGICTLDKDGRVTLWNTAAEKMFGWTEEEALGRPLPFIPEDERGQFETRLARVAQGETITGVEQVRARKDGSTIVVRSAGAPLLDAAGQFAGAVGIAMDVTESRRAQAALAESEFRFRTLFHNASDAIFIGDLEGRTLEVNEAACRTLGYDRARLLEMSPGDIDANGWDVVGQRIERIFREGEMVFETRFRRADGSEFPVEMHARMIEYGGAPAVLAAARDITGRKRVEESLREANETLQALFDACPAAIFVLTPEGLVTMWNRAAERMFGWTEDEVLGRPLPVVPAERRHEFDAHRRCLAAGGSISGSVLERVRKDGTPISVQLFAAPLRGGDGQVTGFMSVLTDIRAQKEAEAALRASEARFRALFEQAAVGIAEVALDGRFLNVNDRMAAFLGYSREELLGKSFPEVTHPDDVGPGIEALGALIEGRLTTFSFEKRYIRKDGATVWGNLSTSVIRSGTGEALCFLSVIEDIEQRKQTERERRLLADTIAASRNEVYLFDAETWQFRFANAGALRNIGYTLEEIRRLTPLDLKTAFSRESFHGLIGPLLRHESPLQVFEGEHRRKDGSAYPVEVHLQLFETADDRVFLAVVQDITERRRAEQAIRDSEQRFRQVVESAPEAIFVQTGGRFRYANPETLRLLGAADPSDLLGAPVLERVHPDDRPQVARRIERVKAERRAAPLAVERLLRLDGSTLEVEASATPFRYQDEDGALVFFRDVTERRRAEEERARLEEQLTQARKMESIGRLAGGVAHDFNNHLTVINGYCDLVLRRLDGREPLHHQISQVRKAGEKAAALTRQLLAFSRKQVVEPRPLNLNEIVADSKGMLDRLVGDDIEIVTAPGRALGPVMADAGQLHQVLMNLVVNARDAMPGGGRIIIETANVELDETYQVGRPEVPPGSYVQLSVTDTGVGMDAETLAQIFEPFFTTRSASGGTGLGLPTVYGIVRQSGGWVWAYSERGVGTTFRVYLPRVDMPAASLPAQPPAQEVPRGYETVLLVEDQHEVRELVADILNSCGYRVLSAANGAEAAETAGRHTGPIHLLLTDVVMPGMTGRDLAGRLTLERPQLKVLYMSGYTANVIAHQGVLDPGVHHIQKPFSPAALAAKVREVLGPPAPPGVILVVDDDDQVRSYLAETLGAHGYQVAEAANGKKAVEYLRHHSAALVITDLVMPEQEGFETVEMLRRDYPALKIVVISGAFQGKLLPAARMLGADATLGKPIAPGELIDVVRRLLPG